MRRIMLASLFAALAFPAASDENHHKKNSARGATQSSAALTEGEVRRVDREAKKITLRHGPMPALDMPAHTMVFQVRDPAMLDQVKPGDKVKFEAEKVGGVFTITKMELSQ